MRHWMCVFLCSAAVSMLAAGAHAGCCDVTKVDTESSAPSVRVCEPAADGSCGNVLYTGALNLGDSENVCTSGETIVYQEWSDQEAAYAAPVSAFCDGGVVEL